MRSWSFEIYQNQKDPSCRFEDINRQSKANFYHSDFFLVFISFRTLCLLGYFNWFERNAIRDANKRKQLAKTFVTKCDLAQMKAASCEILCSLTRTYAHSVRESSGKK